MASARPTIPEGAKDTLDAKFEALFGEAVVTVYTKDLSKWLKLQESVQRFMYLPKYGYNLADHILKNADAGIKIITAVADEGRSKTSAQMADRMQGLINMVIDAVNKVQGNIRIWIKEGEGDIDKDMVTSAVNLFVPLMQVSASIKQHAQRGLATPVKPVPRDQKL